MGETAFACKSMEIDPSNMEETTKQKKRKKKKRNKKRRNSNSNDSSTSSRSRRGKKVSVQVPSAIEYPSMSCI